jgi:radical SAM superfamily enzyme YgiQ (UPF0313 family)
MRDIFCISAGQTFVKKKSEIHKRNQYLNYGLLGLASILAKYDFRPIVIHGRFDTPLNVFNHCISLGLATTNLPILLSIPSFYALEWSKQFIDLVKNRLPYIKIILGGRWVVGERPDLIRKYIQNADFVIPGLADDKILGLIHETTHSTLNGTFLNNGVQSHIKLNYDLLDERYKFQPSVEVSRGCGMGCSFCQEKNEPLQNLKSPDLLIEEIRSIYIEDEQKKMNFYFESSMFMPNLKWAKDLKDLYVSEALNFQWRTEGRVDAIKLDCLKPLSEAGLKILDLGLESASHQQLRKMKKTKNPELYLKRASNLIKNAASLGIWLKVNVLLYAGETRDTIQETLNWLDEHKDFIKGVSVGPVIVYGWQDDINEYLKELYTYGASSYESPILGVTHLNLSGEINYKESLKLSKFISDRYMTRKDYYDLKSFSYFARDYSYDDFLKDDQIEL